MLKTLLAQLQAPAPEARIEALHTLAMLEETEALGILAQMWKSEQNSDVRQVVAWAGRQIHAAKQRGYTTIEAMAETFRVDLGPDEKELEEKRKLSQIQTHINIEQTKLHGETDESRMMGSFTRNAAMSSAAGLVMGLGVGAMMAGLSPTINTSHSLSDGTTDNPTIGREPIIPPRPSDTPVNVWLKKLDAPDPATRKQALIQLRDFNNPAVLGPLAAHFIKESEPALQQLIQQVGKYVYFCALFWQDHDPNRNTERIKEIRTQSQTSKQKRTTQT